MVVVRVSSIFSTKIDLRMTDAVVEIGAAEEGSGGSCERIRNVCWRKEKDG
jgi:hypothetical protein